MSGVSFILEKFWLNSGWNDDKIWLGHVIKRIALWKGDAEMSKKLTEKSLEKKLHDMGKKNSFK